jgi:uncharacterized membrane protein
MQLAIAFGSLVAVSFAVGASFAAFGLWMVLPFVGLELIAVMVAFVWIARHAADAERIELARGRLIVERFDGRRRSRWEFDPARVRIRLDERGASDGAEVSVQLAERGERVEIGRHLVTASRLRLARELQGALACARADRAACRSGETLQAGTT